MTSIEVLEALSKYAKKYRLEAAASMVRNRHMNELPDDSPIEQEVIDAVLTDFINYIGVHCGIDYALYTKDLKETDAKDR